MIPARKRWGQHFLVHGETAERIVGAARLRPEETVIEVGPGDGALTRPLLRQARRLLAIEIDPQRVTALGAALGQPVGFSLRLGDALEKSFSQWLAAEGWSGPAVLVGNLPYNVATPLLVGAMEEPETIDRILVTVQREVARRLAAHAGEDSYGYLSVRVAASARARILFDLPPGAFRPRPKVVSSVLEIYPREDRLESSVRERVLTAASLAFRSRRKTLANALSSLGGRRIWEDALVHHGLDPRVRGEELSLDDYVALTRLVETAS